MWRNVILLGYAQTAAVGIVLLTGSTVYTELSGRSCTSKFDRKSSSVLLCLSLPFDVKGLVMDLCLIQRAVFEGAPAQTLENTTVLVAQIPRMQQNRSI